MDVRGLSGPRLRIRAVGDRMSDILMRPMRRGQADRHDDDGRYTMTTTFEALRAILANDYKLEPETLTLDSPLEELGIDSLGVLELLFNIEQEFKITLPPDAVPLPTLGDVVRYIDRLIAAQHGAEVQPGIAAPPASRAP